MLVCMVVCKVGALCEISGQRWWMVSPLAQVDMQEIKQEFQRMYKKTLQSYIKDDTSGDYERILLAIVK